MSAAADKNEEDRRWSTNVRLLAADRFLQNNKKCAAASSAAEDGGD
jgi:hypothetical protein